MAQGVGQWPNFLKGENFHLGGFDFSGLEIEVSSAEVGKGGVAFDMAAGGTRRQTTTADAYAPRGAGQIVTFDIGWVPILNEVAYHRIARFPTLADMGGMTASVATPIPDAWALSGDSRTQWTLSHQTSAGTLGYIEPPSAVIANRDGTESSTLSIITAGSPSSSEILVDNSADSHTITTAATGPGASANSGKIFFFHYYPVLTVSGIKLSWQNSEKNAVDVSVVVTCAPVAKDWSADAP